MKRWFVVRTQPQAEAKVAAHLRRQDFEVYLPRYAKTRRHARREERIAAPLFPRYLFVCLDLDRHRWRAVNGTRGVERLICHGERPAPVPASVIEDLKHQERADGLLAPASLVLFERGARVRLVDGAFAERVGIYERMTADQRIVLLLNLLGRELRLTVPLETIDAA
ncbi:MAG: transcriptional activator RfaH [Alphaproteobacteria bacterium]|nr:transcriptional activator RfaH [Alphaproteobacteria bacterium]